MLWTCSILSIQVTRVVPSPSQWITRRTTDTDEFMTIEGVVQGRSANGDHVRPEKKEKFYAHTSQSVTRSTQNPPRSSSNASKGICIDKVQSYFFCWANQDFLDSIIYYVCPLVEVMI